MVIFFRRKRWRGRCCEEASRRGIAEGAAGGVSRKVPRRMSRETSRKASWGMSREILRKVLRKASWKARCGGATEGAAESTAQTAAGDAARGIAEVDMENGLFKIGEMARLFHVSVSTLRHYDKLGLVSPEYVDSESGYRYYSTRQFERLNTIRYLRELDIPLERIQEFIERRGIAGVRAMLEQQRADVMLRQERLFAIQRKIDNRLAQIDEATHAQMDSISIEEKPARRIALLRKSFSVHNALDLEIHIRELERDEESTAVFLGKVGIGLTKEALEGRRFHPYEVVFMFLDEDDDRQGHATILPEETCVVVRFQGSHDKAPQHYEQVLDYIEQQGMKVAGFSKEVTMIDFGLTNDVSEFVTEIQVPVEK